MEFLNGIRPHLPNIGALVLATSLFALIIWLLVRKTPQVSVWLQAKLTTDLKVRGHTLLSSTQLRTGVSYGLTSVAWSVGLLSAYAWVTFELTRFEATRLLGTTLASWLIDRISRLVTDALRAIPGLFTAALILAAARFLARQAHRLFAAVEAGALKLPAVYAETAAPTRRLVIAAIWLFAIIAAYPYLPGSDSEAFKGVGVLVGLILSLGSSGVANQAMSGFVLMYARSLKPGDFIRVGEHEGTVTELGLLATKINTSFGEELTVPNAVMVSNATTNFSRNGEGVVVRTTVTIGYDTPWRQVHALLELAALRTPGVMPTPRPIVLQRELSDFYPQYTLAVRCARAEDRQQILSALLASIQDCFNEFGVQIMSPHFIADPPEPIVVPKEKWHQAPAEPAEEPRAPPQRRRA